LFTSWAQAAIKFLFATYPQEVHKTEFGIGLPGIFLHGGEGVFCPEQGV
jgi:hypothetical protein